MDPLGHLLLLHVQAQGSQMAGAWLVGPRPVTLDAWPGHHGLGAAV
jgi:hypothetical protein